MGVGVGVLTGLALGEAGLGDAVAVGFGDADTLGFGDGEAEADGDGDADEDGEAEGVADGSSESFVGDGEAEAAVGVGDGAASSARAGVPASVMTSSGATNAGKRAIGPEDAATRKQTSST